jgi:hypothetical protein
MIDEASETFAVELPDERASAPASGQASSIT